MDDMLGVLLRTVDRLLLAQGADPAAVPENDKLFIAIEHVEVVAVNLCPQEDRLAPVPESEPAQP